MIEMFGVSNTRILLKPVELITLRLPYLYLPWGSASASSKSVIVTAQQQPQPQQQNNHNCSWVETK